MKHEACTAQPKKIKIYYPFYKHPLNIISHYFIPPKQHPAQKLNSFFHSSPIYHTKQPQIPIYIYLQLHPLCIYNLITYYTIYIQKLYL